MHGVIGRINAKPGMRDELLTTLGSGTGRLPGCLSYIVARDIDAGDVIWVTEIWENAAAHAAALRLPQVKETIARVRPMMIGIERVATTHVTSGL
ncbi:putative quinol monooxygenase [Pseudoroseicyclus sp. CXY001]|uniref:putative quinol monooxygenase n=1 Tax=Pseudoroseicyclus sp. CXY001 TaxID=3242492 RepID=UPI00357151AC